MTTDKKTGVNADANKDRDKNAQKGQNTREQKRAAALRDNLKKRKMQIRERIVAEQSS